MRTTTIQIARILRDALDPKDLARVVEALEGYLIGNDPEAGVLPNPTLVRRTDVAGDLLDRIETHMRDDAMGGDTEDARGNDPAEPAHETSFTGYTAEEEEETDPADHGQRETR